MEHHPPTIIIPLGNGDRTRRRRFTEKCFCLKRTSDSFFCLFLQNLSTLYKDLLHLIIKCIVLLELLYFILNMFVQLTINTYYSLSTIRWLYFMTLIINFSSSNQFIVSIFTRHRANIITRIILLKTWWRPTLTRLLLILK